MTTQPIPCLHCTTPIHPGTRALVFGAWGIHRSCFLLAPGSLTRRLAGRKVAA